jgi:hypothetical protein
MQKIKVIRICAGPSGSETGDSPSYGSRVRRFEDLLSAKKVDVKQLRGLAFNGIPDKAGLRAVAWKVRIKLSACVSFL